MKKIGIVLFIFVVAAVAVVAWFGRGAKSDTAPPPPGGGASPAPVAAIPSPIPSPNANLLASGRSQGPIIENEDLTPGLKGVDADKNGIRDDIDRLIAERYSGTLQLKKAAEQKARALQKFMEAQTKQQVLLSVDEIRRSGACVYKILPERTREQQKIRNSLSRQIEALTGNTKERFTKYWQSSSLAGGSVFPQPKEPVCD